jgi:Winged helix DNA-binding domain
VQRIGVEERRARLVRRHRLDPGSRASSVAAVAEALVALHSTDPVTVFLSVLARSEGLDPAAIERELYEERTVVRMLGMRRTLFVVPRAFRPVVQTACTDEIAARERKRLLGWLGDSPGVDDPDAWLRGAERAALDALAARGESATAELVRAEPLLATPVQLGTGKWALTASAGSRVLPLLAAQGLLLRGRPRGTWISGQYRWNVAAAWLGEEQPMPALADARAELVRAWLRAFGPGTETDLRWWMGLGARPIREALAAVGAVEVGLDGGTGYVLPNDLDPSPAPAPSAALLPTLDPTTMGWKERDWYLGEYAEVLFDSNGNAGPTVWWEGRVVGGWAQRADGEIAYELLEDDGSDAKAAVEAEAARVRSWLGETRFKPGFLPPFQRTLGGG